jgi:long-chain acyl-CoA synthetase
LDPLIAEIIVSGENNGLTATIYPDEDLIKNKGLSKDAVKASLQTLIDQYNSSQPTYRHITQLIVRNEPFARNTTGKIKRFINTTRSAKNPAV